MTNAKDFFTIASKIVKNNPVLTILENVQMKEGRLIVTDLETSLIFNADWIDSAIDARIDFKTLKAIYTKVPAKKKDTFEVKPGNVIDTVNIHIEGRHLFTLPSNAPAADFPVFDRVENTGSNWFEFTQNSDLKQLAKVYCSKDDLRPAMQGIYFDGIHERIEGDAYSRSNDKPVMIATDAHRMKWIDLENTFTGHFILPAKCALLMPDKACTVVIGENNTEWIFDNCVILSRSIDAVYPDYTSVIPSKFTTYAEVRRAELIESLQYALIAANQTTNQVKMCLNTGIVLSSNDIDFDNAYESRLLTGSYTGSEVVIGFNGAFLLDTAKEINTDIVSIELCGDNKAALFNGNTIVMPVMLNA